MDSKLFAQAQRIMDQADEVLDDRHEAHGQHLLRFRASGVRRLRLFGKFAGMALGILFRGRALLRIRSK